MSSLPKLPRVHLDDEAYQQLRLQVLERDGWRCQTCGSMTNLEVHHAQFRSHQGDDAETNLITLCAQCHELIHTEMEKTAGKRTPKNCGRPQGGDRTLG